MAVNPHDLVALVERAQRARADIATVRAETLQTRAESRRLLTSIRSETASIAPSPRADATDDHVERIDQERHDGDGLVGQLAVAQATARAIAHALNQPLAVIRGLTELLQTAPPGESSANDLAQILIATDRAAGIVRDLVRVARYTTQLAADGSPMLDMRTAIDPPAQLE
jgi:signal transduction histidine kinase